MKVQLVLAAGVLMMATAGCSGFGRSASPSTPPPLETPTAVVRQANATATAVAQSTSGKAQASATQAAAASAPPAVPQARAVEPRGAAPGAPYNTASPGASTAAPEADARYAVDRFLAALKADPSGKTAMPYLAPDLKQQLQGGTTPASLLGIQSAYQSYSVDASKPNGAKQADVTASLRFGQSTEKRVFSVTEQGSTWLIEKIAQPSASPSAASS